MGMVVYTQRQTGEQVQADFPLHPSLVNFTRADGSTGQAFREQFDRDYGQKLPDLPKPNTALIPEGEHDPAVLAPQPYEAPTLTKLEPSSTLPRRTSLGS